MIKKCEPDEIRWCTKIILYNNLVYELKATKTIITIINYYYYYYYYYYYIVDGKICKTFQILSVGRNGLPGPRNMNVNKKYDVLCL